MCVCIAQSNENLSNGTILSTDVGHLQECLMMWSDNKLSLAGPCISAFCDGQLRNDASIACQRQPWLNDDDRVPLSR